MAGTKPPSDLGTAGRRLWCRFTGACVLDVAEIPVLHKVCTLEDHAERIAAAVADAPVTVVGSMGQPTVHPGYQAFRELARIQAKLLESIAPEDTAAGSAAARRLARERWARSSA